MTGGGRGSRDGTFEFDGPGALGGHWAARARSSANGGGIVAWNRCKKKSTQDANRSCRTGRYPVQSPWGGGGVTVTLAIHVVGIIRQNAPVERVKGKSTALSIGKHFRVEEWVVERIINNGTDS